MDSFDFINDVRLRVDTVNIVFHFIVELSKNCVEDDLLRKLYKYDEGTYLHSLNVATLSVLIGFSLDFSIDGLQELFKAGLFHDIGKMRIRNDIINKNRTLTKDEYRDVQMHSFIGYCLLKELDFSNDILNGVLEHHEKWDGFGYPEGKKGESISLFGRILAVADVFEALTSDRSYHNAVSVEEAVTYMQSTNYFDKKILMKFIKMAGIY